MKKFLFIILFLGNFFPIALQAQIDEKYIVKKYIDGYGKEIIGIRVPGKPPDHYRMPVVTSDKGSVILPNVPGYDWSFGCSATSAAMLAGYYDRTNYPDIYSGPANGGIAPLDNSIWGTITINGEVRSQCPISATRLGVDGRTGRGHVDDYWIAYNSAADDPYITNGWIQHDYDECTGDYMKINQSVFNNADGSTTFWYNTDGSPYIGDGSNNDGLFGLKQFFESKGYEITTYYNQLIYGYEGNTSGFTFAQYKEQIETGRPVLIQVQGHTMLGFGYNDAGNIIYLHDTWDYQTHEMTWGGLYDGMQQYGVGIIELQQNLNPPSTNIYRLEYFLDTDPGFGNGTILSPLADSNITKSFNIPLTNVPTGIHILYLRAKDSEGKWGMTQTMPFYRFTYQDTAITRLEYFIDTDPGPGSATLIPVSDPSGNIIESFNIPLQNLSEGIHSLFIRARQPGDSWGIVQVMPFFKTNVNPFQIAHLEYFIDTDPGFGNGMPVTVDPSDNITAIFDLDLSEVTAGIHTLYLRAKDNNQNWSIVTNKPFYRFPFTTSPDVTSIEYFIDTDPGMGMGTDVLVIPSSPNITQSFIADLSCYQPGSHKIYFRTKDEFGRRSLTTNQEITITYQAPFIAVIGLTILCEGETVLFKVPSTAGRTYKWLKNGAPIPGATDSIYYASQSGNYRAVINHHNLCQDTTAAVQVSVSPVTVGGAITGGSRICKGSSTGTLTLINQTGAVQKWQKRRNNGSWTDIANTAVTYSEVPVYSGQWEYRAQVKSGPCPVEFSTAAAIIVDTITVAGSITGTSSVCRATTGIVYSIQPIPNATGYQWTLPQGATINGPVNTNTITVDYSVTAISGNIVVRGINTCGNGVSSPSFYVTVKPLPLPTITGPSTGCTGTAEVTYSTESGMTNYLWNISSGGTIISGSGTASILVSWNNSGSQYVAVTYTGVNGCAPLTPTQKTVIVNQLPFEAGIISGADTVRQGQSGIAYSIPAISNAMGYTWALPPGASIVSGDHTNNIVVNFAADAVSGVIQVWGTNTCGDGIPSPEFMVTVNPLVPAQLELTNVIVGTDQTKCYDATQTITVAGNGTLFIVLNGGSSTLIAGHNIRLLNGTTVMPGGYLWGYITTNDQYCGVRTRTLVNNPMDINETDITTGPEAFFKVYPNPTTGKFRLEIEGSFAISTSIIKIYGLMGNEILHEETIGKQLNEFSLESSPNGIYIIMVMSENHVGLVKVIKQQ